MSSSVLTHGLLEVEVLGQRASAWLRLALYWAKQFSKEVVPIEKSSSSGQKPSFPFVLFNMER